MKKRTLPMQEIVDRLMTGETGAEIAEKSGCNRVNIHQRIKSHLGYNLNPKKVIEILQEKIKKLEGE